MTAALNIGCRIAAVALVAAMATGCLPDPTFAMAPGFSINVVKPYFTEKNLAELPKVKKSIYDRYGPPDFMRILWTPKGELQSNQKRHLEVRYKKYRDHDRSWIYLDMGKEVWFTGELDHKFKDLTPQLRVVCDLGDPEKIDRRTVRGGGYFLEWTYYSVGERYRFDENGGLLKKDYFQYMHGRLPE